MNKEELTDKIKKMVEELRPYLNMDGGDIEFIKYEDNYLYVKLTGDTKWYKSNFIIYIANASSKIIKS